MKLGKNNHLLRQSFFVKFYKDQSKIVEFFIHGQFLILCQFFTHTLSYRRRHLTYHPPTPFLSTQLLNDPYANLSNVIMEAAKPNSPVHTAPKRKVVTLFLVGYFPSHFTQAGLVTRRFTLCIDNIISLCWTMKFQDNGSSFAIGSLIPNFKSQLY